VPARSRRHPYDRAGKWAGSACRRTESRPYPADAAAMPRNHAIERRCPPSCRGGRWTRPRTNWRLGFVSAMRLSCVWSRILVHCRCGGRCIPRAVTVPGAGAGVVSEVHVFFRDRVPSGRLVVLGPEGAGKSVLAHQSAGELCRELVPVVRRSCVIGVRGPCRAPGGLTGWAARHPMVAGSRRRVSDRTGCRLRSRS
jgi:hypothetical protein